MRDPMESVNKVCAVARAAGFDVVTMSRDRSVYLTALGGAFQVTVEFQVANLRTGFARFHNAKVRDASAPGAEPGIVWAMRDLERLFAARAVLAVYVLRHVEDDDDGRYAGEVSLHATREAAIAYLAPKVRKRWDRVADERGVPEQPPDDDTEAVEVYFAARDEEGYSLYREEVRGAATGERVYGLMPPGADEDRVRCSRL